MKFAKVSSLRGEISVPGDKSISHRAIMLGSLAKGTTEVTNFLQGADCLSTISCFRKMGVSIENLGDKVLIHGNGKPMIYALSHIALGRCRKEAHEDLIKGEIPIGKLLKKYEIESRREINNIYVEKPTPTLTELFKTTEDFISRDYVIISNGKIIMWTKESFPISSFSL